jgi:quaternary ammonium compound-resistance protein SugE
MNWFLLILAGLFEVGFTTCMKLSEGFTKKAPSAGFLVFAILSFVLLNKATNKGIPLGTAYAVWTGIGAFGTALIGIVFFKDELSAGRVFFLAALIGSIIGLKVVSAH